MKRTVPFLWPATMTLSLTSMSPESDRDDALDLLRPATQITLHLSLTSLSPESDRDDGLDLLRPATQITLHLSLTSIEVTSQTETMVLTCSDLPHKSLYTCLWPLERSPVRQRRWSWLAQTCHTNHSTLVSDLYRGHQSDRDDGLDLLRPATQITLHLSLTSIEVTSRTETMVLTCSDLPHKSLYTCLWPL